MRDAVENGWPQPLALEEHSHAAMANAYEAGAANLPFAMFRGYIGVDLPKVNPAIRSVTCPYTGEVLATVPAIRPDVTIIHALRADRDGNVLIEGIVGVQLQERSHGWGSHVIEFFAVGTAIVPTQGESRLPEPIPTISLND